MFGSALAISNDTHMRVTRKKKLLLESVTKARDTIGGLDLEKGFLNDVENHLTDSRII